MKNFVASLHTHVRSIFDAHIEPKELCEKIEAMGGEGCAITDHGVVSAIEDYRAVFKDYGLKFIPGVEIYVDDGEPKFSHLVLLAKNDNGYRGICKVVTESNRNIVDDKPVIKEDRLFEVLAEYKDDMYCLTACIYGVICSVILRNKTTKKHIMKMYAQQSAFTSPSSKKYQGLLADMDNLKKELDEATNEKNELSYWANMKFTQRKKAVEKLEKTGDPKAVDLRAQLDADIKKSEEATKSLEDAKKKISEIKAREKELKKEFDPIADSVKEYEAMGEKIKEVEGTMEDEAGLRKYAYSKLLKYKEFFGSNLYAEIQYHGLEDERNSMPVLVKMARAAGVPLVATNDVHILENTKEQRLKRCIIKSLEDKKKSAFVEEKAGEDQLYLKSNDELLSMLKEIVDEDTAIEAINNIEIIFNDCNVEFKTGEHYPVYQKGADANQILDQHIAAGIKRKFPQGLDDEHKKRLEYEVKIIKDMGYADYHLIVEDYLKYGRLLSKVPNRFIKDAPLSIPELEEYINKNNFNMPGFTIGPGRGSAVGSLVCYILDIVTLDPIKYGLLFERFLNPERVSMPDIDCDFAKSIRAKAIDYVKAKYGENAVCGIMTVNSQAPKGVLRIAAKYYGLKKDHVPMTNLGDTLAKDVPKDVGTKFNTVFDGKSVKEMLLEKYKNNPDAVEIINWAVAIEGIFTSYGQHAAGVVISDNDDISDYIPLRWNSNMGMMTSQCDMAQVEQNGLLKFDFLGLITLDVLTECVRRIYENHGKYIDLLQIPLDDENVYKNILSQGKTKSVFQFESSGMISMLKRFKPTCFEDLIILVAMYRPGPLQYLDDVIKVKNGETQMEFLTPELKPILEMTYGAIVYQEQVMQVCQSLAGFTLGHSDEVRRFMSKKKHDKLAHERESFVKGCENNNISADIANELFDQMQDFASYAFNKSHAAAYAYLAYMTAWLKNYYPAEFFTAALNQTDKDTKIMGLVYEASSLGIKILPPDVNMSEAGFSIENGSIRFGLASIKGVSSTGEAIMEERMKGSYISFKDFYLRNKPDSRTITNLISAGACDRFSKNREALKQAAAEYREKMGDYTKCTSFIASAEYVLPMIEKLGSDEELIDLQKSNGLKAEVKTLTTAEKLNARLETKKSQLVRLNSEIDMIKILNVEEDIDEKMKLEKQYLGMYITANPMDYYPTAEEIGAEPISQIGEETTCIYGIISGLQIKERKTDKKPMAFFTLEDKSGDVSVCMFTDAYSNYGSRIQEGAVLKINGKTNIEVWEDSDGNIEENIKFFVSSVSDLQKKKSTYLIEVSSIAVFHTDIEPIFRKDYEQKDGHPVMLRDKALGELRKLNYKVSEKVKTILNAEEVFI